MVLNLYQGLVPLYSGFPEMRTLRAHAKNRGALRAPISTTIGGTDLYQDLVPLYSGTECSHSWYKFSTTIYSGTNSCYKSVPLYSGTNSWYSTDSVPLRIGTNSTVQIQYHSIVVLIP